MSLQVSWQPGQDEVMVRIVRIRIRVKVSVSVNRVRVRVGMENSTSHVYLSVPDGK